MKLIIDNEHETTLDEFLTDNEEGLDGEEIRAIIALLPDQTYHGGGGASATWTVKRIE